MVTATVRNTSPSLRAIPNIDRHMVTLRPGEAKTIELHSHTAMLLEREATRTREDQKAPLIEVHVSTHERADYETELRAIRAGNAKARAGARVLVGARQVQSKPRLARVDPRFVADPKMVGDDDEPEPQTYQELVKETMAVPSPPPADAARVRKKAATKRVVLKDKKG